MIMAASLIPASERTALISSALCFKEKGAIMAGAVILMSLLRGAVILLSTHPDDAAGSVEVGFIMAIFALLGFFAAWLLAFAFRREKK